MSTLGNLSNQPRSSIPPLLTKEIQDLYTRQNFVKLTEYFQAQNQFLNFKFYELVLTAATTTTQSLSHGLGFVPKDIVVTQATGSGVITFLFGQFDKNSIYYSATGPCRIRFYVGTYFGDTSTAQAQASDNQSFAALTSVIVNGGGGNSTPDNDPIDTEPPDTEPPDVDPASFSFPPGAILPYAGTNSTLPTPGWLMCDGASYSTAAFPDLFNVIGYSHGGSGPNFNVPDYRGRFLRGTDNMGTSRGAAGVDPDASSRTAMATGGNTGNNVGSIQPDQIVAHAHSLNADSGAGGSFTAVGFGSVGSFPLRTQNAGNCINNTGGNETRPKNANVNYIIRCTA